MAATVEKYGDVVVLSMDAEFTGDTAQQFRAVAEAQLAEGHLWFVLDLLKATALDSQALETLLWFRDEVEGHTGLAKVCGLDETCAKIFELTRFDHKFEVFDDVTGAVKSYE